MKRVSCCVLLLLTTSSSYAADDGPPWLLVDTGLYPYQHDVKDDVDFTITTNAGMGRRLSYFSFVNFRGAVTDGNAVFDRSEQNLRWRISEKLPIDLNVQAIIVKGDGNDVTQLGIGWRIDDTPAFRDFFDKLNLTYRLTWQFKRFDSGDNKGWQLEHFFRMTFPYVSDRLYLSGFVDHSFDRTLPDTIPDKPIVTEVQLGMRMFGRFYALTEYRVNQFRVADENNWVLGVEYKFRW